MQHFVVLGIHEPGHVPGIDRRVARVRMFRSEDRTEFQDDDFPVDPAPGVPMSIEFATYALRRTVEAKMAELFRD